MGRIGESSDDRRMREMNEAKLRKEVDQSKKGKSDRTERSFQQVMADRGGRKIAKQNAEKHQAHQNQAENEKAKKQARPTQPRSPMEMRRRQAVKNLLQKGTAKRRTTESDDAKLTSQARAQDQIVKTEDDQVVIDKDLRHEDEEELVQREEQQTELKQEANADGAGQPVQRQSQNNSGGQQQQDQNSPKGVQASEGPKSAHVVNIPREIIEKLVNTVYKAVNKDGRTSMQIVLKGGVLEGVVLKISSDSGKVSCAFEGCHPQLKSALRQTKAGLMRGLSKRGLKLVNMRIS